MTARSPDPLTRPQEFWAGFRATTPLVVGAIPFGLIFGTLAVTSGLTPAGAMGLSVFVFAGSSQFVAAGLVASGTSIGFIILTTFIVNLRHALYATTLAPHMRHLSHKWLLPLGFWLTDESFVVTINRYEQKDTSPHKHWYFFGSAVFMYLNWNLWTLIGVLGGQSLAERFDIGLEFAMVATFIGMLIPMVKGRPTVVAIVVAFITALLANGLPNKLGLIVAALAGVSAGAFVESRVPEGVPTPRGGNHE